MKVAVAEPLLTGNEKAYVLDALETAWISGSGKYVTQFEERFADFCEAKHAVAVFNGTVALHLAMIVLGIGAGDEVIVPDLTYIASPNSVRYVNADPVLVDIDPVTWTIDPADVARRITPRTKAIMPVHLYGHPAAMDPLLALAQEHNLFIIEDAAEAHGAEYKGRRVGGIGTLSTFSFFGNKIITTGEGGMVVTNDAALAQEVRLYRGQGMDPNRRYWFPVIGYNYRMTNVQAAIGVAQLERIDWFIERRLEVAHWYNEAFKNSDMTLPAQADWARNVYWLYAPVVPEGIDRDRLMAQMAADGVETRPFFYPMHSLPPYFDADGDAKYPWTTRLSARGVNLPSSATLTRQQVQYVAASLLKALDEQRLAARL